MQAAKFGVNRARGFQDRRNAALRDAGAVHTRIHVDKNSDAALFPRGGLLRIFGQHGDPRPGVGFSELADARGIGSHHRIRQQDVGDSGLARRGELDRGGAFGLKNAALDHLAHDESELGGFDMGPPAVGVAAEQAEGGGDVVVDDPGINGQSGSEQLAVVFDEIRRCRNHNNQLTG